MEISYAEMTIPAMAGKVNDIIFLRISSELKGTEIEKDIIIEVKRHYRQIK